MKIAVIGLGYIGSVSAGCFARNGHEVIGVDINPEKVADFQQGKSPVIEPGLAELMPMLGHKKWSVDSNLGSRFCRSE